MSFSRMVRLIKQDQSGFTILEAMIGGILLGIVAVGILPALVGLIETQKVSSFKSICSAYTRAKLNEYVNGYGSGDLLFIPTGYEYTKHRYQTYSNATYCANATLEHPGWRERVSSNAIVAPTAGQEPDLGGRMQGFQLYVMIKNYNMRELTDGNQPTRECPPTDYQYFALGDAFEVTVTGMVRTSPLISEGGRTDTSLPTDEQERPWGGLKDINATTPNPRLTCSSTQIIYPQRSPFRYYLGSDGKIRNYQATYARATGSINSSLEAMESHYRSIWSSEATGAGATLDTPTLGNVQSFAIAPDNKSAYILKAGELTRYNNCTYRTVQVGGLNFPGAPDCSLDDSDIMVWEVDSNIENITVDFKSMGLHTDDRIYGLFNTGTTEGLGEARIKVLDVDGVSKGDHADWVDPAVSESFAFPEAFPRIRGMFIGQPFPPVAKPNIFFFDNTCYQPPGAASTTQWVYCNTIFNSGDIEQAFDVRELPVQTEAISY